jgi:hypothetical protein
MYNYLVARVAKNTNFVLIPAITISIILIKCIEIYFFAALMPKNSLPSILGLDATQQGRGTPQPQRYSGWMLGTSTTFFNCLKSII